MYSSFRSLSKFADISLLVFCALFSETLLVVCALFSETPSTYSLCTVNGNWGDWGPYTKCSISCTSTTGGPINGTYTRTRACDNPPAQFGGDPCPGSDIETSECVPENECPSKWSIIGSSLQVRLLDRDRQQLTRNYCISKSYCVLFQSLVYLRCLIIELECTIITSFSSCHNARLRIDFHITHVS